VLEFEALSVPAGIRGKLNCKAIKGCKLPADAGLLCDEDFAAAWEELSDTVK